MSHSFTPEKMPRRRFGRTELAMPVFTCGGMRFQHSWKDDDPATIPDENQRNLEETVRHALSLGINHIETARGYGTSEVQLGRFLREFPRDEMIIQTKVSPECDAAKFRETFERSMACLRLDHVDLLSLHGINNHEILTHSLEPGGPLAVAREIQQEGRAKFIGFSTHASCDVITRAINTGEFDYVNLHWYWVNQSNSTAIEAAAAQDVGVFIISPNDKGGKLYAPPEKLRRLCEPLSPMAFNNLFCLANPSVHTLSVGAARPSDFDEHIRSLSHLADTGALVPAISDRLEEAMAAEFGQEWINQWQIGIPPWESCPDEIHVWEILRLFLFAKSLDMVDFAKMRYNLLGQAGHWFPGKNAAEFSDAKMLEALRSSPLCERIPSVLREAHSLLFEKPIERLSQSE